MGSGCHRSENNLSEYHQPVEITIAKVSSDFSFNLYIPNLSMQKAGEYQS